MDVFEFSFSERANTTIHWKSESGTVDMILLLGPTPSECYQQCGSLDNVARNGIALLSVLRNTCRQSNLSVCGAQLSRPKLSYFRTSWIWRVLLPYIRRCLLG